jgi:hypothetical protein
MFKHALVLLGKAWRRLDEGTLLPWTFGRLRAACEWRALREARMRLRQNEGINELQIDETYRVS